MKAIKSIWLAGSKFICWFVFSIGWVRWWSFLYRKIWEKQYITSISIYKNIDELVKFISSLTWTADGWRQLWDSISKPEKVEYIGRFGDKKVGDCDDFASYETKAFLVAHENGYLLEFQNPKLLTVIWMEPVGWKQNGHAVCLLETNRAGKMLFGYMDYGYPYWFEDLEAVIKHIIKRYAGESQLVAYMVAHPVTLKKEIVKTSLTK